MAEPVDPIAHLDFNPRCEWSVSGERCMLIAAAKLRWECRCVTMVCSIHALAIRPTARFECPQHGAREALEGKEPLWR
ncbi:hypothetical protein SEA_FRANSOYER_7 [Microbacterium phage Fransoyer]|nr:hypothetical protein SEA_FRANSOYER_7 [Microbacterium phage Fransoyer]